MFFSFFKINQRQYAFLQRKAQQWFTAQKSVLILHNSQILLFIQYDQSLKIHHKALVLRLFS